MIPVRSMVVVALVAAFFSACGAPEPAELDAALAPAPVAPVDDEAAVRAAFEEYRAALLAGDGERVLGAVDRGTVDWYRARLDEARSIDRAALDALGPTEKFTVLRLRHDFDATALDALTGERLVVLAVEKGWVQRATVERAELGRVTVEGDGQSATASSETDPETLAFYFGRRDDGGWGVAPWRTVPAADRALDALVAEYGTTIDRYLVSSLETLTGRPVDSAIFDGPR